MFSANKLSKSDREVSATHRACTLLFAIFLMILSYPRHFADECKLSLIPGKDAT